MNGLQMDDSQVVFSSNFQELPPLPVHNRQCALPIRQVLPRIEAVAPHVLLVVGVSRVILKLGLEQVRKEAPTT